MNNIINRRRFLIASAACGLLPAVSCVSTTNNKTTPRHTDDLNIEALFNKAISISGTVGAQLSIIKDGQQQDYVYGLANAELNIPMRRDTIIQIGSTTKLFNAMLVMTLVDKGLLSLDEPVQHYLPEFSVEDEDASKSITLRQLLSMSSGLDNGAYTDHGTGEDALKKYIDSLKHLPQVFPPGTAFGYSNAGTSIAGYVAEKVMGKPWDLLLKENILNPAALKNAASLEQDLLFQRIAVGHIPGVDGSKPSVIRPWHMIRSQAPAGSTLAMSAHDLAAFGQLFLDGGVAVSGQRVLSSRGVKTMMTPQIELPMHFYAKSWGVGPSLDKWSDIKVWGHGGSNRSGRSYLYWLPEKRGVIAFILNTPAAMDRFAKVIFRELTHAAFGVSKPLITAPNPPYTLINPRRYVGSYESPNWSLCTIVEQNNALIVRERYGLGGHEKTYRLLPLGGDRFYIDNNTKPDPLTLPADMAFFGQDDQGRAQYMTSKVFTLRRTNR